MPSITVTQTQVDGTDNAEMNNELAAKRFNGSSYTTGLIAGRFSISNEVHATGRVFKADNSEFASAAPPVKLKGSVSSATGTATLNRATVGVQVGDIILVGSYNYFGGSGSTDPGLTSGFTNITTGGYSTYFRYRWSYRIATSSDTTGSLTVNTGNRNILIAVFKIDGSNTPVKANHSSTTWQAEVAGPISVSSTTNGALLVMGMATGTYDTATTEYSDDAGTRYAIDNTAHAGAWVQEIPAAGVGNILAYKGVSPGQTMSNQSALLPNSGFRGQLIVHFTRT